MVACLARDAVAAGHEVALLAHPDSDVAGVARHALTGAPRPGPGHTAVNAMRVRATVREFEPHLLHSFARLANLLPLLRGGLPKIMSFQREPTPRTVRWASRLARDTLTFVGCSESVSRRGRACGGRWETVLNGVDLELYPFRHAVADDAPLVFLSRIERVKGPHLAIAAARATGKPKSRPGSVATASSTPGRSTTRAKASCSAGPPRCSYPWPGRNRSASSSRRPSPAARRSFPPRGARCRKSSNRAGKAFSARTSRNSRTPSGTFPASAAPIAARGPRRISPAARCSGATNSFMSGGSTRPDAGIHGKRIPAQPMVTFAMGSRRRKRRRSRPARHSSFSAKPALR